MTCFSSKRGAKTGSHIGKMPFLINTVIIITMTSSATKIQHLVPFSEALQFVHWDKQCPHRDLPAKFLSGGSNFSTGTGTDTRSARVRNSASTTTTMTNLLYNKKRKTNGRTASSYDTSPLFAGIDEVVSTVKILDYVCCICYKPLVLFALVVTFVSCSAFKFFIFPSFLSSQTT
jgi:hypothetical protein